MKTKRQSQMVTYQGKELPLPVVAKIVKLPLQLLRGRIGLGRTLEEAINEPYTSHYARRWLYWQGYVPSGYDLINHIIDHYEEANIPIALIYVGDNVIDSISENEQEFSRGSHVFRGVRLELGYRLNTIMVHTGERLINCTFFKALDNA